MRMLIQRVRRASVEVENRTVGKINRGFLVLVGFNKEDTEALLPKMVDKCLNLRIFEDEQGKMNLSLLDFKGELLIVSQFTLYANCKKGRRPSFDNSMPPIEAERLYALTLEQFHRSGVKVESGVFAARMNVSLVNDGPVTIMIDSDELN